MRQRSGVDVTAFVSLPRARALTACASHLAHHVTRLPTAENQGDAAERGVSPIMATEGQVVADTPGGYTLSAAKWAIGQIRPRAGSSWISEMSALRTLSASIHLLPMGMSRSSHEARKPG